MRKLTRIIVPAVLATAALGSAGAASAQPYGDHHWGQHTPARANAIREQIQDLQRRVDRNDFRGRISDREAAGLRQDVRRLQEQFRMFNRNGLDNREMRVLENRIQNIRDRLKFERHDRDGRRW
jgi:Spy/CpxP family protein refolding chaperone